MTITRGKAYGLAGVPVGKDVLLKAATDFLGEPEPVGGLRVKSANRNRIAGRGIFKNAASDEIVRGLFFNGSVRDWTVVVPDEGSFEGPMQVAHLEFAESKGSEATYDIALESAGVIEFRPITPPGESE